MVLLTVKARSKLTDFSALQRSRQLRRNATDAEQKLWALLRDRRLAGVKFRCQTPLGEFIVDFCSKPRKLVIELDGGQHTDNARYDAQRTSWLEERGYQVLRFWNHDVLANIDGVLTVILSALEKGESNLA